MNDRRPVPILAALCTLLSVPLSLHGQLPSDSGLAPGGELGSVGFATLTELSSGDQGVAQDTGAPEWSNVTELSFLLSGGNAGASSLGLRNSLRRVAPDGEFRVDLTALRTDAIRSQRTAEGAGPDDFIVREDRERERTVERYGVQFRYDRRLSDRFFAFGGSGWDRNLLGGFEHRTVTSIGAGNRWGPGGEEWRIRVGYGVTYTVQRDVTPDPERDDSFAGARLTLDYEHQISESTTTETNWIIDGNAQRTRAFRGDFSTSLTTSLASRLGFQTTVQILWDNDPPLERLSLVAPSGESLQEDVLVPLRRLDHSVSLGLVFTL